MITILFHVSVLPGKVDQFRAMARKMTESSRKDDGNIDYIFYIRIEQPNEVVLYERWRDRDALGAHIARLIADYGPADDDPNLAPTDVRRRLPKSFMDLLASAEPVRYEPVLVEDVVS